VAAEEREQAGAFCGDDVGEPAIAEGIVADEIDCPDLGAPAFVHVEDDVHAVLPKIDGASAYRSIVPPNPRIGRPDAFQVHIELLWRKRTARLDLHGCGKLGILELLVALEEN